MTIQPIAIVPSVNDLPNVNEDGPNGASITDKLNQVIGVLNPLAEAVDLLVDSPSPVYSPPQVLSFPEENISFNLTADHVNTLIFLGHYQGLNFSFSTSELAAKTLAPIIIINTTDYDIPLGNFGNNNLWYCPDEITQGQTSVFRSRGKLQIYFSNTENVYICGSIVNVMAGS